MLNAIYVWQRNNKGVKIIVYILDYFIGHSVYVIARSLLIKNLPSKAELKLATFPKFLFIE